MAIRAPDGANKGGGKNGEREGVISFQQIKEKQYHEIMKLGN